MRAAACGSKRISAWSSSAACRCITIAPRMWSPRPMRWCSWWSRASPSKPTWRGRSADRCAPCGGTRGAMRRAGWRRSVGEEGWRRGRRRISGKRLRSIEILKSQGMSNRAIAHRLGVSEKAIRKLVGPSKPAESAQLAFAGMTTAAGRCRAVHQVAASNDDAAACVGSADEARRRQRSDRRACGRR